MVFRHFFIVIIWSLSACTVKPSGPYSMPSFIVSFEKSSTNFNNRFNLSQYLSTLAQSLNRKHRGGQRPIIVVVGAGSSLSDYQLLLRRWQSIKAITDLPDADYRLVIRENDHSNRLDRLSFFGVDTWNRLAQDTTQYADAVWLPEVEMAYPSDSVRLFFHRAQAHWVSWKGKNIQDQWTSGIEALGWTVKGDICPKNDCDPLPERLAVVTLQPVASREEIQLLMSGLIKRFLPNHRYQLHAAHKQIVIWKPEG